MNGHSYIGASSADRWIHCPGSVRLYKELGDRRRSTIYSATGTVAHEICEKCLLTGKEPIEFLGMEMEADSFRVRVTDEIVNAATIYVGKIRMDKYQHGGRLVVEQSFDLSWVHPGMYGRNDASLIPDLVWGTLRVYDYKNGKHKVFAKDNPQLMYYSVGALGENNPLCVENVEMNIIQPNAFGKDPVESHVISVKDLYDWTYDVLRPAAALTEKEDAPFHEGDHCTFCEAAGICPLRQQQALALLDKPTEVSPVATLPAVDSLSAERVGILSAFFQSDLFKNWVSALAATEFEMLSSGVEVPGRKLVESSSLGNREWVDESKVTEALRDILGDDLLITKLKSPSQVEKALTALGLKKDKRAELLAPIVKREEKVTLKVVSEDTDVRPSIKENQKAALDLLKKGE